MDDDTIEETELSDDVIETVPDNVALEVGDDTVVTSAAAPEHDDSPWPDRNRAVRGVVFYTSGSTRIQS